MVDKPSYRRLRPEVARRIANDVAAFALEFYEQGSGNAFPLQWQDDAEIVNRFVEAVGLQRAQPDEPTADLEHTAFVRTSDATEYRFGLVDVFEGNGGMAVFVGGHARCSVDLHEVVCVAYGLERYDSERESRWTKISGA